MAKLPVVSGKDAARAFEKIGFVHRSTVGSHMIYKRPGVGTLSIPNHKELDLGLLKRLISDAGVTSEKFIELLG
ncbi:MAG: type II toxin-antitoxin system HicA family toxin [Armatimonadota bacterium]|nr:type II toxin-antitoxin system HicA family toxin [Armatimonadota bacterium]